MMKIDPKNERKITQIQSFIQTTISRYHFSGVVIGISGGIDSALTACLAVKALGAHRVFGVLMPDRDSARTTLRDSKLVCEHLQIAYKIISLSPLLRKIGVYRLHPPAKLFPRFIQERYVQNAFRNEREHPYLLDLQNQGSPRFRRGQAFYRIKHRLRNVLLYFEAEQRGAAVLGCTNKTELLTGLYVKWGDDSADISPIAHLYKTEVFQLAEAVGLPVEIIRKPPSPDLVPGLTDEFALGLSYCEIDRILQKIERQESLIDENADHVQYLRMISANLSLRKLKSAYLEGD